MSDAAYNSGSYLILVVTGLVVLAALANRVFRGIHSKEEDQPTPLPHVTHRKGYWIFGVVLTVAIIGILNHHLDQLGANPTWHVVINASAFAGIAIQLLLAHANKPIVAPEIVRHNVVVVVPVYNEDPVTFREMLNSMSLQSRKPNLIHIIDDGSDSDDCLNAYNEWSETSDIKSIFHTQVNSGKRVAQSVAFKDTPTASIYVTVDSDTVLDPYAIENILMPFSADPKIQSAAGLLLGLNWKRNLLTRLVDLGFVSSFLSGRSAWSKLNSVSVNCGGLAAYRGHVVRKHLDEYTNQKVFGSPVACGDDRILTNFASLEGKTKFQESSVGYTLHPANLRHLSKQRIRWWRSFFFGSEWLTRRISPKKAVYWLVLSQILEFVLYSIVLVAIVPYVVIVNPVLHQHVPFALLIYVFGIGYLRNIRYLSVRRPDQSFLAQLGVFALAPFAVLLNAWLCTILQYAGLATVNKTGWSTRSKVEVGMEPKAALTTE